MDGYGTNYCAYDNCDKNFDSIHELITHIEAIHIDFNADYDYVKNFVEYEDMDAPVLSIPMSLVLRYSEEEDAAAVRKCEGPGDITPDADNDFSLLAPSEDLAESGPSQPGRRAHWNGPELNPGMLMHKRQYAYKQAPKPAKVKKFQCPVRGCTKSYKNPNGMKYHLMNFHDINNNNNNSDAGASQGGAGAAPRVKKEFNCVQCQKSYKTIRGLQSHIQLHQLLQSATIPKRARAAAHLETQYRQPDPGPPQYYQRVQLLKQIYNNFDGASEQQCSFAHAFRNGAAERKPNFELLRMPAHPYHGVHPPLAYPSAAAGRAARGGVYADCLTPRPPDVEWTYEHALRDAGRRAGYANGGEERAISAAGKEDEEKNPNRVAEGFVPRVDGDLGYEKVMDVTDTNRINYC